MNGSLPGRLRQALNKFSTDRDYGELVRTSFFAFLVRMTGVFTGFLVTLLTSRYFGADALGIVAICLAILSFSSVFGKAGLDVALMKYVAGFSAQNNYAGMKSVYLSSLRIIFPITLFVSLLLFLLAPWMAENLMHKPQLTNLLRLNAWIALPLVFLLVHSESIRGLKRIKTYTFLQTVSVSMIATVLLLAASFMFDENSIPAYIQFISISIAGILSVFLWLKYSRFAQSDSVGEVKPGELFRTSTSMFTTTLMQLTMSWAGTLILAVYVNEAQVGIYNALVRISVFTNITILAVNSFSMPRFAESYTAQRYDSMKKLAGESARLIFITSLPIFIVLALFPHWILSIFGKEFPGNEYALYILLAGQFIVCFSGLPSQILNMAGRQNVLRNIAILSALINVILCMVLIPKYGISGACYAQLGGTFVWNILSIWSVKKHFGFFVFFNFSFKEK